MKLPKISQPTKPETARLDASLRLERCPHCGIARPFLARRASLETGHPTRYWGVYVCSVCESVVLAVAFMSGGPLLASYPAAPSLPEEIPERPREYLRQAQEALTQPAGSLMLAASAIDAMLKLKGYKDGSLYDRIEKAASDHLITKDMAQWAHQVRLDANDQRHADEAAPLPAQQDAERSLRFALALAEFLFVLPAKVTRGIEEAKGGGR